MASRLHLLALVPLACVLAACGERSEPLGALPQAYPVTVRGAGDKAATLAARPSRVVALDPGSAELVVALGGSERLVGEPAATHGGGSPTIVVSRTGQVDVGAIARLKPDLIVSTSAVDQLDTSLAARRSDATLYVQPDSSVAGVLRGTIELGFLLGEPVRARQLAGRLEAKVEGVKAKVAREPTFTVFVDTGFFITVPQGSLLGDLLRLAHGKSVAGPAPGPDPFPVERLRQLDPDVYLATSESRVTLAQLRRDPRTARLTAVREKHFSVLPSDLVLRPGPRLGQALERVASALHPDAFR